MIITADSPELDDVQIAVNAADDDDTVIIPSGTDVPWTGNLSISAGIILKGPGALHSTDSGLGTTGSNLLTIIDDNPTPGHSLISGSVPTGKLLRILDLGILSGGSFATTQNGVIAIYGGNNCIRIGRCYFNVTPDSSMIIAVNGSGALATGVVDHNFFDSDGGYGPVCVYLENGYSHDGRYNNGDMEWSLSDDLGTERAIFVEHNRWRNGMLGDCNRGGQKIVYRDNTNIDEIGDANPVTSYVANHGLTNDRWRGTRTTEFYRNRCETPNLNKSPIPFNSGTGIVALNSIIGYRFVTDIGYTRKDSGTYPYGTPPSGWGPNDGTTPQPFDNPSGYPAMDQPGRGQGDLLGFDVDPGLGNGTIEHTINTRTGTQADVQQASAPIYVFGNDFDPGGYDPTPLVAISGPSALIQANRDFYQQFGAHAEAGTFDGSRGVGEGSLASRPTSGLTAGVGWWAPEQGDQGVLYVATGPTTWVEKWRPYTSPHPLTLSDDPAPMPDSAPTLITPPVETADPVVGGTWTTDNGTVSGSPTPTLTVTIYECTEP